MRIQVLGMGCAKCNKLLNNARAALQQAGVDGEVKKVDDMRQIAQMGVMSTPALVINGEVKVAGSVPTPAEIAVWVKEAS